MDVEEAVNIGGDVVLDDAHVQWGIPGSYEGLPANQGQLGGFLTKSFMEEKEQPGADKGNRYDVVGGGCPARWHYRHPGVQKEQLSIILQRERYIGKMAREKTEILNFFFPTSNNIDPNSVASLSASLSSIELWVAFVAQCYIHTSTHLQFFHTY